MIDKARRAKHVLNILLIKVKKRSENKKILQNEQNKVMDLVHAAIANKYLRFKSYKWIK